jgi:putative ABC transport system substrate-binding protein
MASINDPVGSGFVKSLAHPGGNITGISNQAADLGSKQFEMLRDMVPKLSSVAILLNPTNSGHAPILNTIRAAAQRTNVNVLPAEARTPQEIENAFSQMARQNIRAVIVPSDPFFIQQRQQIVALTVKTRMPSIFWGREAVEAGGLMSYGTNTFDIFRRAATYVDKIFKGVKPADLPVEQPTKFELFINGKTAKALGLKIPQSLLLRADQIIE